MELTQIKQRAIARFRANSKVFIGILVAFFVVIVCCIGVSLSEPSTGTASYPPLTPQEEAAYQAKYGDNIDYRDFYVNAKSSGLPVGKRYNFRAEIDEHLLISESNSATNGFSKLMQGSDAFDDRDQYRQLLRESGTRVSHNIVAAMGSDGRILIERVD